MKQFVSILKNDKELFKGKIANIPMKEAWIIKKSIELFDDEDPCIIHQSYIVKEFVDVILELCKKNNTKTIQVKDYLEQLSFLDYSDLELLTIHIL